MNCPSPVAEPRNHAASVLAEAFKRAPDSRSIENIGESSHKAQLLRGCERPSAATNRNVDAGVNPTITLVPSIHAPAKVREISLQEAANWMMNGENGLSSMIAELRKLSALSLDPHRDPSQRPELESKATKLKLSLPAIIPSGTFSYASDKGLLCHSGLAVVDIDGIDSRAMLNLRLRIIEQRDPRVRMIVISPSGLGLKVFVAISAQNPEEHKKMIQLEILPSFSRKWSIPILASVSNPQNEGASLWIDGVGVEVSRKCFLSFDPFLYTQVPQADQAPERNPIGVNCCTYITDCSAIIDSSDIGTSSSSPVSQKHLRSLVSAEKLKEYLPQKLHDTDRKGFNLARYLKAISPLPTDEEVQAVAVRWANSMNPAFRSRSPEEYEAELIRKFYRARSDPNTLDAAIRHVLDNPLPQIAQRFSYNVQLARLAALIVAITEIKGEKEFFLAAQDPLAKFLGYSHGMQAYRLLERLVKMERPLITVIKKGTVGLKGEATVYRLLES